MTLDFAPGPGRRPEGEPTHPPNKPDFPPPPPRDPPPSKSGHLPISGPRAGFVPQDAVARESAPGAGAGPSTLAQLVSDLRLMLAGALARTQHQWDPASGPAQEDAPIGPAYVDRKVMNARADIRAALAELDELRVVVSLTSPDAPSEKEPTPGSAVAVVAAARASTVGGHTCGAGADLHDPERPTVPKPMPGFALPQPPRWSW